MNYQGELCNSNDSLKCAACNYGKGLTLKKQIVLHSELYQKIKRSVAIQFLKNKRKSIYAGRVELETYPPKNLESVENDFERLKNYYRKIVDCFDVIHANSEQSAEIYKEFFHESRVVVVPITNAKITRQRHERDFEHPINFGYLGGPGKYKGYDVFYFSLKYLDESGRRNWHAWFYGGEFGHKMEKDERKHYIGQFSAECAEKVWKNIDVLVVPSQWKETFGFVVLEALSKEIPVICSNLVGSNYLLKKANCLELIFNYTDVLELSQKMSELIPIETYRKTQRKIERMKWEYDMKCHTNKMLNVYRGIVDEKKTY